MVPLKWRMSGKLIWLDAGALNGPWYFPLKFNAFALRFNAWRTNRFTPYNGVPGYEAWVRFERDLLKFGGTADDHGWSYADVFQGLDDGGNLGAALPALPGTADDRAI